MLFLRLAKDDVSSRGAAVVLCDRNALRKGVWRVEEKPFVFRKEIERIGRKLSIRFGHFLMAKKCCERRGATWRKIGRMEPLEQAMWKKAWRLIEVVSAASLLHAYDYAIDAQRD